MMRAAAVCSWVLSLGFGLPAVYGAWYFARTSEVWTLFGFPSYGGGPFERVGLTTSVPLLAAFVVVCAAEFVQGWLLWRRRTAGTWLGLALLPLEFAFWIGFALPFGPPLGILRTVLSLPGLRRRSTSGGVGT